MISRSRICGRSVCTGCSTSMRRLSRNDSNHYRVCDDCDDKLINKKAEAELRSLLEGKTHELKLNMGEIEAITNRIEDHKQELEVLKKRVPEIEREFAEDAKQLRREDAKYQRLVEGDLASKESLEKSIALNEKMVQDFTLVLGETKEQLKKAEEHHLKELDKVAKAETKFKRYQHLLDTQKAQLDSKA